jgi:predicted NBD/HSP70 family sugar kinase
MYIAIDVGGTKTLIAVFNNHGVVQETKKFETPTDYPAFIECLAQNVALLSTNEFSYGCIAIPGKVDRLHGIGIAFGNLPWKDISIQADIETICHCPFFVENDANLAGLSEAVLLKDSYRKVLYLTVSTGIGSIYVIDGVMDNDTLDAEVGNMLLEHRGKLASWQSFASGKAIVKQFGKRASDIDDQAAWYSIAHNLAVGIITLIATYTPEVIVIGGGVGTHINKFHDTLVDILKIYENPLVSIPPIVGAQRAEEAVIYGCYELIYQRTAKHDTK